MALFACMQLLTVSENVEAKMRIMAQMTIIPEWISSNPPSTQPSRWIYARSDYLQVLATQQQQERTVVQRLQKKIEPLEAKY